MSWILKLFKKKEPVKVVAKEEDLTAKLQDLTFESWWHEQIRHRTTEPSPYISNKLAQSDPYEKAPSTPYKPYEDITTSIVIDCLSSSFSSTIDTPSLNIDTPSLNIDFGGGSFGGAGSGGDW